MTSILKRLGALPTAAGAIARLAYGRARRAGIELKPLLKKAGLTDQQIKDRGTRLAVHDQITFLNLVANALGDEFLGFHLAQLPDLRELGLLFYVAASSETLGDALRRAARYSSIVNEGLSIKCIEGEEFRVECEYVGVARHSDRHQIEFFMTVVVRLCRHLTGLRLMPSRTRIAHRRTQGGRFRTRRILWRQHHFWSESRRAYFRGKHQGHAGRECRPLPQRDSGGELRASAFSPTRRTAARSERRWRMQSCRCCRTESCARRRSPRNSA